MKKPYADNAVLSEHQLSSCDRSMAEPKEKGKAGGPVPERNHLRQVSGRKRQAADMTVDVTRRLMVKQREMVANEFEQYYHSKNLPVEVELSGPDKTSIGLFSVLFHADSVDRIVERTNLFYHLREAGFQKVVLGDIETKTWAYDL